MILVIIDNLMGFMNPNGEVYSLASQAVHIAHGESIWIILLLLLCIICILCVVLLKHLHNAIY